MDIKALSVNEIIEMIDEIDIKEYPLLIELFLNDSRVAVKKLGSRIENQYKKYLVEIARIEKMKEFENQLYESGCMMIAGVDEVGRGPLAGPVVAAAVILPKNFNGLGIDDSKKLTEKRREELLYHIEKYALGIGIGIVDNEIIDKINILNATKDAMNKAIGALNNTPNHVLIDAITLDGLQIRQTGIIKGDQKSISIASASIVAKVTRDRIMCQYHDLYPHYDFISNKGYGTEKHYEGLRKHGLCPLHRKSFLKELIREDKR